MVTYRRTDRIRLIQICRQCVNVYGFSLWTHTGKLAIKHRRPEETCMEAGTTEEEKTKHRKTREEIPGKSQVGFRCATTASFGRCSLIRRRERWQPGVRADCAPAGRPAGAPLIPIEDRTAFGLGPRRKAAQASLLLLLVVLNLINPGHCWV